MPASDAFHRVPAWLWVLPLWAVLYLPNAGLPELEFEEGTRAVQARSLLTDGRWYLPEVCGIPYINKPPLYPWLVVAFSRATGGLNEWSVRLPALMATLVTGIAVFLLVRRAASPAAGLFGAAAFFLTPLTLQKGGLGESDALVMATSFVAFLLWWREQSTGRVRGLAWVACGLVLSLGAMAKGPPSLIYFALSVLIPAAFRRHVRDLAGLAVCLGISLVPVVLWARAVYQPDSAIEWTVQMLRTGDRLQAWTYLSNKAVFLAGVVAATLPWVAIGLLPWLVRQAAPGARDLWRVLLIYAAAGTVVVALAIETSARYALPAAPALAAAAGLVFDRLRSGARRTARVLAVIVVAASIGRVCYVTWVVPWRAEAHSEYRSAAAAIALALPGNEILYKYAGGKYSLVYYLDRPVVEVDICQLAALPDGAIALFDAQAFPPAPPLWFEKIAETAIGDSDRRVIVARMKRPPPRSGPDSAVR